MIQSITFADPFLEDAVRKIIGKPAGEIYGSDLEGLKVLDANSMDVTDLTGLEYCTSLISLDVERCFLTTQLNKRKYDSVTGDNPVTEQEETYVPLELYNIIPLTGLASIRNLNNLARLVISGNHVGDITELSNLSSLKVLKMWNNKIEDISPMRGLVNLVNLDASANDIRDLSALASLCDLRLLNLSLNKIKNLAPLSKLQKLRVLEIESNQLQEISHLSSLTLLIKLVLDMNLITDISPLSSLTNLHHLSLSGNQIIDLSPLVNLRNLKVLELYNSGITDIDVLAEGCESGKLNKLEFIGMASNPLAERTIKETIPRLRKIGIKLDFENECPERDL